MCMILFVEVAELCFSEMFVMSQCPDAMDGEATIAQVMEKVGNKVNLNFTYIARYESRFVQQTYDSWQNTSKGIEIHCKHGSTECYANRQQLWYRLTSPVLMISFQKYHPTQFLQFVSCLNRSPSQVGKSLSYTLHCAERARVDDYTKVIQPCAESEEGQDLLAQSATRCNALNVHTSATIRVAAKNVCVRDGGEWLDCRDVLSKGGGNVALGLQKMIEREWSKNNSQRVLAYQFSADPNSFSRKRGRNLELCLSIIIAFSLFGTWHNSIYHRRIIRCIGSTRV